MRTKYQITPGACLIAAFLLLLLPLKWLAAAFFAALFHELCHYAALRLCRVRLQAVSVGGNGTAMEIGQLSCGKELLCALAGPLGSLLLLAVQRWFPRVALCGVFHGLYNLLPIFPLDGGRALRCGARLLLPPDLADRLSTGIEMLCLGGICLAALYGTLCLKLGLLPLGFALLLLIKRKNVKFPCKPGQQGVQ